MIDRTEQYVGRTISVANCVPAWGLPEREHLSGAIQGIVSRPFQSDILTGYRMTVFFVFPDGVSSAVLISGPNAEETCAILEGLLVDD